MSTEYIRKNIKEIVFCTPFFWTTRALITFENFLVICNAKIFEYYNIHLKYCSF